MTDKPKVKITFQTAALKKVGQFMSIEKDEDTIMSVRVDGAFVDREAKDLEEGDLFSEPGTSGASTGPRNKVNTVVKVEKLTVEKPPVEKPPVEKPPVD